jgi:hypothetical protein
VGKPQNQSRKQSIYERLCIRFTLFVGFHPLQHPRFSSPHPQSAGNTFTTKNGALSVSRIQGFGKPMSVVRWMRKLDA